MTRVGIVIGGDQPDLLSLPRAYTDAVLAAGGHPVLLPTTYAHRMAALDVALNGADAILLAGGGDISYAHYGQEKTATAYDVDPERDQMEIHVAQWALSRGVRVLGVCRGAQMLAVVTGGTLYQDLPAAGHFGHGVETSGRTRAQAWHGITAEPGTVAAWLLDGVTEVNSQHHQAVQDPGPRLRITAYSTDGVAEAVEGAEVLGVQWHPELLIADGAQQLRCFRWLVDGQKALPAAHEVSQ